MAFIYVRRQESLWHFHAKLSFVIHSKYARHGNADFSIRPDILTAQGSFIRIQLVSSDPAGPSDIFAATNLLWT